MIENKRSPRAFEAFSKKIGTSVAMLNNNYVQIDRIMKKMNIMVFKKTNKMILKNY